MNFGVVFISYLEQNAQENFEQLQKQFPASIRIHGIKGMHEAFKHVLKVCSEEYIYTVDGDNWVLPSFTFPLPPKPPGEPQVKIWRTINPVNGLEYGYGGIKLWNRSALLLISDTQLDVIDGTQVRKTFVPDIASITAFNCSPESAWRAGFRESCLLTSQAGVLMSRDAVRTRLDIWLTKGIDSKNGSWAIQGAKDGVLFAENPTSDLSLINNYEWLETEFDARYPTGD